MSAHKIAPEGRLFSRMPAVLVPCVYLTEIHDFVNIIVKTCSKSACVHGLTLSKVC